MTNADKIASHILKYGPNSLIIHTIPQTRFWLVCQQKEEKPTIWRIILCDPDKKTWRLVSSNTQEEDHVKIWEDLTKIQLRESMQNNVKVLKKHADNYYYNKHRKVKNL